MGVMTGHQRKDVEPLLRAAFEACARPRKLPSFWA